LASFATAPTIGTEVGAEDRYVWDKDSATASFPRSVPVCEDGKDLAERCRTFRQKL